MYSIYLSPHDHVDHEQSGSLMLLGHHGANPLADWNWQALTIWDLLLAMDELQRMSSNLKGLNANTRKTQAAA